MAPKRFGAKKARGGMIVPARNMSTTWKPGKKHAKKKGKLTTVTRSVTVKGYHHPAHNTTAYKTTRKYKVRR